MAATFFFMYETGLPDLLVGDFVPWSTYYERHVLVGAKPSEEQFQIHYDTTKHIFANEGYSEKETKWWFLRTGQGPSCFKQYQVGVSCGLPPLDVWQNWYFHPWAGEPVPGPRPWVESTPIYPPPGYSMPGMPCNTAGKRFDINNPAEPLLNAFWSWTGGAGPWPFTDIPEMAMTTPSFTLFGLEDWRGAGARAFCDDVTVGMLHPVPLAWTVFKRSEVEAGARAASSGSGVGAIVVRGLPIGIMAMLDKYTNKQWPSYFEGKVREYMAYQYIGGFANYGIAVRAWPLALRDTLNYFGVTDPAVWSFQQKIDEVAIKLAPRPRKHGVTIMAAGDFGTYFTMAVIAFITWGVASAASALLAEAVAAAEASAALEAAAVAEAAAAAGETVTIVESVSVGEMVDSAKQAQTVYNVVKEVQSDNPNLLSLASNLLKVNNSFDLLGADVSSATEYDYGWDVLEPIAVGGDQLGFDYSGENLMPLDLTEAAEATGAMLTEAANAASPDFDFASVDFAGSTAESMQTALDNVVANLGQYAGDPAALYSAIEDAAANVTAVETEFALAVISETQTVEIETALGDAMANNADIAAATDVGPLTVDQLDMAALDEGWTTAETTGLTYEDAASEGLETQQAAAEAFAEIPMEDVQKLLEVGAKIAAIVEPVVVAPPPPPPPPRPVAALVAAPAPTQPLPGPTATLTYDPGALPFEYATTPAMQLTEDATTPAIQLTTASMGPVATDGEKGFNLWWLLPLGLLALPLGGKRRARRKGRK